MDESCSVRAQIAGLDVGWGQQIDMDWDARTRRYVVTRSLPPGRYPFKFIMDGHWTYSADHPTFTVSACCSWMACMISALLSML